MDKETARVAKVAGPTLPLAMKILNVILDANPTEGQATVALRIAGAMQPTLSLRLGDEEDRELAGERPRVSALHS